MKKYFFALLIFGMLFLSACTTDVKSEENDDHAHTGDEPEDHHENDETTEITSGTNNDNVEATKNVVEIDMIAKQWEFEPDTVTVNEGDTVILHIESIDVNHGIKINDFGVSEFLAAGETVDIEFVADKKGTFSFFCSVSCGSGHGSMRGTLIVN